MCNSANYKVVPSSFMESPGPTWPSTMRSSSAAAAVFFSSTCADKEPLLARGRLKLLSLKDILADCLTPAGCVLSTASSSATENTDIT